jgi:hypothetical protein
MYKDLITVVTSTSPLLSHPSTEIFDKVHESTQFHLPGVETLLLCDGVRTPEHEERRAGYEAYKAKLRNRPLFTVMEWRDSVQQGFMVRSGLALVSTPLVLWQEHDYALTLDPIDWEGIINAIQQDRARVVRFHNTPTIHPLHEHLMLDCFEGATGEAGGTKVSEPPMVCGVPMIRTRQFWCCPFLTTTKWLRGMMDDTTLFTENTYCEIEPVIYGPISYHPWEDYRVMVYAPSEPTMQRSQHIGGRGHDKDDPKREMTW